MTCLAGVPGLAGLPDDTVAQFAARLREERFPAQVAIVSEGEVGDSLYLIVEGRAEVSVQESSGPTPLATLAEGDTFGEIALLAPDARRNATVTAITPVVALALARDDFTRLLDAHPESGAIFA